MWEMIRANQRRSVIMVISMGLLLAAVGYAFGLLFLDGSSFGGLALALVLWAILALVARSSGDSVLLSMAGAHRIEKQHHPVLYNVVEEMSVASGITPMPAVYIIDDPAPNAFATGRDPRNAAVAVTTGLLETLDRNELQGVIAHELGHIKNRDVLFMTRLVVMVGGVVILAELGRRMLWFGGGGRRRTSSRGGGDQAGAILAIVAIVLMILAPIVAQLLYFAASRKREYLADASSAVFTRYPEGLASALEKISRTSLRLRTANSATAPLYIINPLKVSKMGLSDLTSTHPATSERIRILRLMAGNAGFARYNEAFRQVTGRPVGVIPSGEIASAADVPVAVPPVAPVGAAAAMPALADDHQARVRASSNAMWRVHGYAFIPCECGATLKVPPDFPERAVTCPRCGTAHEVAAHRGEG
jgi:heat shock protein HtpX